MAIKSPLKAYFEAQKKLIVRPGVKPSHKPQLELFVEEAQKPDKLSQAIIQLYESLYQQLSLKSHFKFFPRHIDKMLMCRFIKWIKTNKKSHANADFLIAYFEFQFSHYKGVQNIYGVNSIMFSWVIGPKAIKRFEDRKVGMRWLVRLKNKEVGLNLKTVLKDFGKIKKPYENKIYDFEEKDKQRYYNTTQGFLYCLITTTLYNPISELCIKCINKKDCENMLKIEFPKLHKRRCLNNTI